MSAAPVDIAVFSKARRPILAVEVREGELYSTVELATGLRRSLMAHELLPDVPFFMLATPIQIFLWVGDATAGAIPNYSASAEPVMDSYSSKHTNRGRPPRGGALDIVMFFWITDVANGIRPLSADSALDRLLLDSGLYEQIRDGSAEFEVTL